MGSSLSCLLFYQNLRYLLNSNDPIQSNPTRPNKHSKFKTICQEVRNTAQTLVFTVQSTLYKLMKILLKKRPKIPSKKESTILNNIEQTNESEIKGSFGHYQVAELLKQSIETSNRHVYRVPYWLIQIVRYILHRYSVLLLHTSVNNVSNSILRFTYKSKIRKQKHLLQTLKCATSTGTPHFFGRLETSFFFCFGNVDEGFNCIVEGVKSLRLPFLYILNLLSFSPIQDIHILGLSTALSQVQVKFPTRSKQLSCHKYQALTIKKKKSNNQK